MDIKEKEKWHYGYTGGTAEIYAPSITKAGELVSICRTTSYDLAQAIIRLPELLAALNELCALASESTGLPESDRASYEQLRDELTMSLMNLSLAYGVEPRMDMPF